MNLLHIFNHHRQWLNAIDVIFWAIITVGTLASVIKGADNTKETGMGCYYTIRLLLFGILFHSLWQLCQLTLLSYRVTAADASFHGLIAALFIWTIYFHRTKTKHWKLHGHSRQSTTANRSTFSQLPTT